jgi:hypothetical protein
MASEKESSAHRAAESDSSHKQMSEKNDEITNLKI